MAITEKKHIFSGIVTLFLLEIMSKLLFVILNSFSNKKLYPLKMEDFFLKFSAIYSDLVGHLRFLISCYFNVDITGTFFTTLFSIRKRFDKS